MQICSARFISLAKNWFCNSAKGNKRESTVGETVPCSILDKQMVYFITTIEICFESAGKESDSKTI